MPSISQIKGWVIQHLEGTLPESDRLALYQWLDASEANRMAIEEFLHEESLLQGIREGYHSRETIWKRLDTAITAHKPQTPIRRMHSPRRWWAAAILLLLATSTALWLRTNNNPAPVIATNTDLPPGGNHAMLTLSNGQKIILDSAHNGQLAAQGNTRILKLDSSQLAYNNKNNASAATSGPMTYNTLSTPRGGQYKIQLPDGSKVWLNAASSITYPTAFTGHDRTVTITGEAYFEVVHDPKSPFRVKTGAQTIEDIGTAFNVNAYTDEPLARTTLVSGSIKLSLSNGTAATLKPGQQAKWNGQDLKLVDGADIDQTLAWKNGIFNFDHADLPAVLRQLSRWYDLDIQYQGAVPIREFIGKLPRDLNLSQVLKVLTEMDIRYRVEGHKLLIEK